MAILYRNIYAMSINGIITEKDDIKAPAYATSDNKTSIFSIEIGDSGSLFSVWIY